MISCSVTVGPVFEGAKIRNGVGGIQGAIDTMDFSDGLRFTTIGAKKAVGICGSGLVDAVAGMLNTEIVDETGRIRDINELPDDVARRFWDRIIEIEGVRAFLIAGGEANIALTQKDIRELQNAKAAVAAGIKTLIKEAGVHICDIGKVYLTGGFGNYINVENAVCIGHLPKVLQIRIVANANAGDQERRKRYCRAERFKRQV